MQHISVISQFEFRGTYFRLRICQFAPPIDRRTIFAHVVKQECTLTETEKLKTIIFALPITSQLIVVGSHDKTISTRFSHHSYCSCQKSSNSPTFYVVCGEVNCVKTISNSYTLKVIFYLPIFALIAFNVLNYCHVINHRKTYHGA